MPKNHSSRKHALLSASGSSRWINCTPSPRLEEPYRGAGSSTYAAEGTLAHEFGDLYLTRALGNITQKSYKDQTAALRLNELYTDEMEGQVKKYTDYVTAQYLAARSKTPDAVLNVEERVDFSHVVENGFGTGDSIVIGDGVLEVIDLKYGKGVPVYADNNSQLMLYGLGSYAVNGLFFDIHTVKLTIVQPRLDSISSWEISVEDLEEWAERIVKPAAKLAYEGEGELKAGSWCRWCAVKARCRAYADMNNEIAKHDFRDPDLLSDEELIEIYEMIPQVSEWIKAVSEYMLEEANSGKKWPGYKLVEGRSRRKWLDEEKVIEALDELGVDSEEYMTSKLNGITKISQLMTVDGFEENLGHLVVKPQGKPTLVKDSDKRPEIGVDQAKIDFSD